MDSMTTAAAASSSSGGNSQDVPSDNLNEVTVGPPILYHERKKLILVRALISKHKNSDIILRNRT